MNSLMIQPKLSKSEISKIEKEVLNHTKYYRENKSEIYCNFVLIPTGIGPIAKRHIFGEKNELLKLIFKKDGDFFEGSDLDYLTKVVSYDIFSKKTLEDLFEDNIIIKPHGNSLPLFSDRHISNFCNNYWSNSKSRELAFPLFYSEILNQIDPNTTQIFDWDILHKKYNEKVKELGFIQDLRDI